MSIGRIDKYVPIYLFIISMDTYRKVGYNIPILGEEGAILGAPDQRRGNDGSQ